jgi:Leucine-rich repeat (LRR) protein
LAAPADYTPVFFPDANLQAAVVAWLNKPEGSVITMNDVNNIYSLDVSGKNIASLAGIEALKNLNSLYAGSNNITDLTPVTGIKKLANLNLQHNGLSDISVLTGANMPYLARVWLDNNNITDVSPLSGKPLLEAVYIQNNTITDISSLASCARLVHLFINNNTVSDISAVSQMPRLIVMGVSGNRNLGNLSPLSTNAVMLEFYAAYCNITDISVVANWTALKSLDLHGNKITDITPIMQGFNSGAYRTAYWNCFADVSGNPLDFKAVNCDVPMLKALGMAVYSDNDIYTDRSVYFIQQVLAQQASASGNDTGIPVNGNIVIKKAK